MLRKRKPYNERNSEALESNFLSETQKLQARRNKVEALTEMRRVTLYGNSSEKLWLQQKLNGEGQLHIMLKEQQAQAKKTQASQQHAQAEAHRQRLMAQQGQRELRRKEALRRTQEDNRLAAESRSVSLIRERIKENAHDRKTLELSMLRYSPSPI